MNSAGQMSYSKRIPSTLRGQFTQCAYIFQVRPRGILGAPDADREHVISTGNLHLVKEFYSSITNNEPPSDALTKKLWYSKEYWRFDCPLDLEVAAYYGNKKVFQYLHGLFGVENYKGSGILPIHSTLFSIIACGRADWLRDYFEKYPDVIKKYTPGFSGLIGRSLLECNFGIIECFVQKSVSIDKNDTNCMRFMLWDFIGGYGMYNNEILESEFRHLCGQLLPIIIQLRDKYPNQVSESAVLPLIPDEVSVDA